MHDSTADLRYLVLPARPAGSEALREEQLAALVTRDCMIGTAVPNLAGWLSDAPTAGAAARRRCRAHAGRCSGNLCRAAGVLRKAVSSGRWG